MPTGVYPRKNGKKTKSVVLSRTISMHVVECPNCQHELLIQCEQEKK